MKPTELCPACLDELPADYPYDHVAVDLTLDGQPHLFKAMTPAERTEVVLAALNRGMTISGLSTALSWPYAHLQALLPDKHPQSTKAQRAANEQVIRELWEQGLPDVTIHLRTGLGASLIGRTRKRLGLATKARSNADRKAMWA